MRRRAVAALTVAALLGAGCSVKPPRTAQGQSDADLDSAGEPAVSLETDVDPLPEGAADLGGSAKGSHAQPPVASTKPAATPPALKAFYQQKLVWKACGGDFRCAQATVPLDYAKPAAGRIQIAMVKLPARKTAQRIGSLFINPGGPGGSGTDYARYAENAIPRAVRDRFDIVGFDPRGVGESAPVRCGTGKQLDTWLSVDPSPDTAVELRDFVSTAKAFAAGCQARSKALLPHISTRNAARDMDVMRAAVGDRKLSFLGKSYGTYLGALYADMFPQRVRALILDGAVDPSVDTQTLGRTQARGFEVALRAFLDNCARNTASCSFGKGGDVTKRFDALLARIERDPLPTGSSRSVGPDEVYYAVAQALYSRQYGWPALRTALARAQDGDGSVLLQLFDSYIDRDDEGNYSNLIESFTAISCLDRPSPKTLAAYQSDARKQAAESPHFGAAAAYSGLTCAYWPVPPVGAPMPLEAKGAAPILVIGTTRDPATPLVWAKALSQQLESGRLLTFDGDGHTVYGDGDGCVDKIGNAYLISLTLPAAGARCG